MHTEKTGYAIDNNENIVTLESYESYFNKFQKSYLGKSGNKELLKVEIHETTQNFILTYAQDCNYCGECDYEGRTEGRCEGHSEPHTEWVEYKLCEIYA